MLWCVVLYCVVASMILYVCSVSKQHFAIFALKFRLRSKLRFGFGFIYFLYYNKLLLHMAKGKSISWESQVEIFSINTHTHTLRLCICQFLASSKRVNRIVYDVAFHMLSDKSYDSPSHNGTWSKCQNELPTSASGQYKCRKYVISSLVRFSLFLTFPL